MRSPGIASIDRGTRAGFRDAQAMFREARRAVRGPTAQTNRFFSWELGCGLAVHVSRSEKICPGGNGRAGKFAQVARYHGARVVGPRSGSAVHGARYVLPSARAAGRGMFHCLTIRAKKSPHVAGLIKAVGD